jgi:hypothetical protein
MSDGNRVSGVQPVVVPVRYEPAEDAGSAPAGEFSHGANHRDGPTPRSQGRPVKADSAAFDYLTGRGLAPSLFKQVQYSPRLGWKRIPIVDGDPVQRVVVNTIPNGPAADRQRRIWTQNIYSVLEGLDPNLHAKVVPATVVHSKDGHLERVFVLEMTERKQGSTDLEGRELPRELPTDIVVFFDGRHYENGAYLKASGDVVDKGLK